MIGTLGFYLYPNYYLNFLTNALNHYWIHICSKVEVYKMSLDLNSYKIGDMKNVC